MWPPGSRVNSIAVSRSSAPGGRSDSAEARDHSLRNDSRPLRLSTGAPSDLDGSWSRSVISISSAAQIRCRDASDGELCPNSTWDKKLGEKPVFWASARTEIRSDLRAARSLGPMFKTMVPSFGCPVLLDESTLAAYSRPVHGCNSRHGVLPRSPRRKVPMWTLPCARHRPRVLEILSAVAGVRCRGILRALSCAREIQRATVPFPSGRSGATCRGTRICRHKPRGFIR